MDLLIVDDHPTNLKLLRAELESEGHAVFEAHDGVDALALLERQRVDGVISDLLMPRMDGYRLCQEIRQHARLRDLPIILYTTTYTSPGDEKLALDRGADKYLKKPASVKTIITALHEVIAQPHVGPRPEALQEIEVLKEYSERLVSKLGEKNTELQAAKDKFRALVEQTIAGIYIIQDDQFVYVNPRMAEILGRSVDEMTSRTLYYFLVPEDQALARENIRKRISGGVPSIRYSLRMLHQSGAVLQVEVHSSRTDYNGRPAVMGVLVDITERKQAEEALRLQSTALTAAANAILITNRDGTIVWVNPAFTTLTGYTLAETVGKNPRDLVKSGQEERAVYQNLWETILSGRTWQGQLVNRRRDGSFYPEEQTITPVRDAHGEITHFIAIKQDLSERKHAEEVLRQCEERYRLLFERAPDVIFALSPTGAIASLNHAFETITGWPLAQWLGRPFQEIIHPDDQPRADELFQLVLRGEHVPTFELRVRTAVGGHRDIEFTGFSSQFSGGHIEVQGIGRDITERKVVERQLREQNEILSNSHEGVMIVNLANEVLLWNRGVEEIFGWTQAEALGRPPEQLLGINELGVVSTLRAAVEREGFWNGDMRMQTRDGRKLIVDCRITLVRDAVGRPRARLAFLTDITEKKLLEEKFLRVQRLESLGTLAGGVAHDLNNALAPIMMGVELLKMQYPKESEILDMIEASAKRGADMVRQLLTFAKGAEGERVLLRPGHLVKELEKLMKGSFPKNIQLVVKCNPNLPAMLGDATQLHQVLLNLCVNARDAMPHGGTLTLEAQSMEVDAVYASSVPDAKPGKYLVLRVRDTGTGIPPEILDRIFDPFFTTKGPDKGTGLGLSTVMGIVKGHGGFLQVYSPPGQGSTFTAYLPAADAGSDTELVTKAAVEFRGQGETILFVDDEPAMLAVARAVLRRLNFKPLTATDGADGLMQVAQHRTELRAIITDVHMPHMDGLAFVRAFRRMLPDIPVMVVSGRMEGTMAGEFKTLGVTSRLDKPFTEVQLAEALKNLLAPK